MSSTSRTVPTVPMITPSSSRSGAAVADTQIGSPSGRVTRPTYSTSPPEKTVLKPSVTGEMSSRTKSIRGVPIISSGGRPVSLRIAGDTQLSRPSRSAVKTMSEACSSINR